MGLSVEKIPTTRNVRSSTLNRSPTSTPKSLAARQPSIISSRASARSERPATTCTPYDCSSFGARPISRKNGWFLPRLPVRTNAPIVLSTPFVCRIAVELLLRHRAVEHVGDALLRHAEVGVADLQDRHRGLAQRRRQHAERQHRGDADRDREHRHDRADVSPPDVVREEPDERHRPSFTRGGRAT